MNLKTHFPSYAHHFSNCVSLPVPGEGFSSDMVTVNCESTICLTFAVQVSVCFLEILRFVCKGSNKLMNIFP